MTNHEGIVLVIGELRSSLELERNKLHQLETVNNELAIQLAKAQDEVRALTNELTHTKAVIINLRGKYETQVLNREVANYAS